MFYSHRINSQVWKDCIIPVLVVMTLLSLVSFSFVNFFTLKKNFSLVRPPSHGRWLYPAESIDLLKGGILLVCVYFSADIDTSVMYHMIKSQSVIKLYLFFNMLEVREKKNMYILHTKNTGVFTCT